MNVCCPNMISPKRPAQGITDMKKAGFENIILYPGVRYPQKNDGPEAEDDLKKYSPDTLLKRYSLLLEKCRENSFRIPIMGISHAYMQQDGPDIMEWLEKTAMETMKLCKEAECKKLIASPPYPRAREGREYAENYNYYMKIAKEAKKYNICLLLESQIKVIGGHIIRDFLAEPSEAAEFIDKLNSSAGFEAFGFCMNTAVCDLCGHDMNAFVTVLGNRLKAVKLSDSDKRSSMGILPFTSAINDMMHTDWLGLIRGLRSIDFDGELIVEYSNTRRAFPPLLKPEIFRLARLVGDYFKWQVQIEQSMKKYQKRVLFGAGNMCRNYMKNYGEKYPPLFTCDNNPKLWGTIFEGLEVKNPEELKKLSSDCGVFICNIYYREIETQLREMGIENIEYFNDEYMPTYYVDRLKMGDY